MNDIWDEQWADYEAGKNEKWDDYTFDDAWGKVLWRECHDSNLIPYNDFEQLQRLNWMRRSWMEDINFTCYRKFADLQMTDLQMYNWQMTDYSTRVIHARISKLF